MPEAVQKGGGPVKIRLAIADFTWPRSPNQIAPNLRTLTPSVG
ncbi:hypothetical protein [Actinacidiphila soli]|nr:hypothetical protein [Actinacidiphila soli]